MLQFSDPEIEQVNNVFMDEEIEGEQPSAIENASGEMHYQNQYQNMPMHQKQEDFRGSGHATNLDGLDHDEILKVIEQEVDGNIEQDDFNHLYGDEDRKDMMLEDQYEYEDEQAESGGEDLEQDIQE